MKNDLTATNEKTIYVVFNLRTGKEVFETDNVGQADSFVKNNYGFEYSKYLPFTYAKNKKQLADDYSTTFQEY